MAVSWHVINGGSDNNSGSTPSTTPKASGTAASLNSTTTVTLSADSPDLSGVVDNQDSIRLNGQTGGAFSSDIFHITGHDNVAKTVTVLETPGTAAGVTWAIGGAFATRQRGLNVLNPFDPIGGATSEKLKICSDITLGAGATGNTVNAGSAGFFGYVVGCDSNGNELSLGSYVTLTANNTSVFVSGQTGYIFKNIKVSTNTSGVLGWDISSTANICYNCWVDAPSGATIGFRTTSNYGSTFAFCKASGLATYGFQGSMVAQYCVATGCGTSGFYTDLTNNYTRCDLMNCIAYANTSHGFTIILGSTPSTCIMDHCTANGNGGSGLLLSGLGGASHISSIVDSIFSNNAQFGISAPTAYLISSRNHYYNNTSGDIGGSSAFETDETNGDPLFVNAASGDFRLQQASPAIRTRGSDILNYAGGAGLSNMPLIGLYNLTG